MLLRYTGRMEYWKVTMDKTLNGRLAKAIEDKRLKSKLEGDLRVVETELGATAVRLKALKTQLDQEKVDVERLERTSLTTLFYQVLGSREEQLEKERQELLAAQLRYHQTQHQLEALEYDLDHLGRRLEALTGAEQAYQAVLAEKERFILASSQPAARELLELSEQVAELNAGSKEFAEAIAAGKEALYSLDEVIDTLESAEGWGVWDMLGGGILSSAIKHSRVDEARQQIADVQAQIGRFQRELADVQASTNLEIHISEFDRFADFILDGLIFDWVVQSKIVDSLRRCKQARWALTTALGDLICQQDELKARLRQLEDLRTRLIEQG